MRMRYASPSIPEETSLGELRGFIMILALSVLLTVVAVNSQVIPANYRDPYNRNYDAYPRSYQWNETPKPYAFSYNAPLDFGGQSSRAETADGSGKVQGSYTVTNDEGHTRVVNYVADQAGFRASIQTNEPGTENKNPADVMIESTAPLTPYQYVPRYRRPYVGAPVVAPVVAPAVAPVLPAEVAPVNAPALYNMPRVLPNTNYYRPRARYPYTGY